MCALAPTSQVLLCFFLLDVSDGGAARMSNQSAAMATSAATCTPDGGTCRPAVALHPHASVRVHVSATACCPNPNPNPSVLSGICSVFAPPPHCFFGSEGEKGVEIRSLSPNIKLEEIGQTFLYLFILVIINGHLMRALADRPCILPISASLSTMSKAPPPPPCPLPMSWLLHSPHGHRIGV